MTVVPNPGARPASALPSVQARALAFVAILIAGAAGAAIGASVTSVECHGSCATPEGIGAVAGGAVAAGGTGVVATLTLRAMGEWKTISEDDLYGDEDEPEADPPQDGVSNRNPSA
jgi:hypothetical protein